MRITAAFRPGLLVGALLLGSAPAAAADPAANVETWVRLKGDATGALTYEWVSGSAQGLPDDAIAQPLFGIESVTVRRFLRIGTSQYIEQTYSCRLYRDLATGEYIDRFTNPFTGREVKFAIRCGAGLALRYTPQRVMLLQWRDLRSTAFDAPLQMERINTGELVVLRRESRSEFRRDANSPWRRESSVDSFIVKAEDLANPQITNLAASYQWTSVAPWMTELDMGARRGVMLWFVSGRKFSSAADLPAGFLKALDRLVPGALTDFAFSDPG